MNRKVIETIEWRRVLVESAVIVVSILLAFVIDAWWDDHKDARREVVLLEGLLADFQSSRAGLEERLALARKMSLANDELLARLGGRSGGTVVNLPDSLVIAVLGGPTYEPNTNTLDSAIATGEIELLESGELRGALANWRRTLADTTEDELEVRRITNQQVVPLLSRSIDLSGSFDRVLPWGQEPDESLAAGGLVAAQASVNLEFATELIGALALRSFYMRFAAQDLEALLRSLEEVMRLLQRELGERA